MPYNEQEKVRVDLTEEQRRNSEQHDDDVEFDVEELEERIAPAKGLPALDGGVL